MNLVDPFKNSCYRCRATNPSGCYHYPNSRTHCPAAQGDANKWSKGGGKKKDNRPPGGGGDGGSSSSSSGGYKWIG